MIQAMNSRKVLCFLVVLSSFTLVLPQVYQANISLNSLLTTTSEQDIESYPLVNPSEELDEDVAFYSNSLLNNNSIIGEPLRIAPNTLYHDEYTTAQDLNGSFYCVWMELVIQRGYTLFYSMSNTSSGIVWTESQPFFRLEKKAYSMQAIFDYNNILHIFFVMEYGDFNRIFHLSLDPTNVSSTEVDYLYTDVENKLSELALTISHNDTLNVAWIAKDKSFDFYPWNSLIQLQRYNVTTGRWLTTPIDLHNESNPIIFDLTSNFDSLKLTYTMQQAFSPEQDIMLTTFNETTKIWTSAKNLTLSDYSISNVNIEMSSDGGSHILWIEEGGYYPLRYIKCAEDETIENTTLRLNGEDRNCYNGRLIEDETGNLHLVIEDKRGFDTQLYYRIKFATNETWSNLTLLIPDQNCLNMFLYKSINYPSQILNIIYSKDGSIFSQSLNITGEWNDEIRIYFGTQISTSPTVVIDSSGVMHLVNYHQIVGKHELLYQTKQVNKTQWDMHGNILVNLTSYVNPKLFLHPNGSLLCLFVKVDPITLFSAIFYIKMLDSSINWTQPLRLFEPTGEIISEQPSITVDKNGTTHIFWRQYVYDAELEEYLIHMFYSFCYENGTDFSEPLQLTNENPYSFAYHFNILLDRNDTLHLVNCEFTSLYLVTSLIYRSMEYGNNWSEAEVLTASYYNIFNPTIIQDSTGRLELIFNNAELVSSQRNYYWTDFESFEKSGDDSSWYYKGLFLKDTGAAGFYSTVLMPDDTIYLVYYDADYTGNWWWNIKLEQLAVIIRAPDGTWGERIVINDLEHYKRLPIGLYNEIEDTFYIIHEFDNTVTWYALQNDTDQDYLGDLDEYYLVTDPNNNDTDQDFLLDGLEVKTYFTNPIINDTDWDTLLDGLEVLVYGCDPLSSDTDRDNLPDQDEVNLYFSDPNNQDSDYDLIPDYIEIMVLGSNPTNNDTDSDLMPDNFEYENNLNLLIDDSQNDEDDDDLNNLGEYLHGTDVYDPDTDDDLLTDGEEVHEYLTDPNNPDTDFDTLTDWEEVMKFFTNPFLADSDGDGFSDRTEIEDGTDPNDPSDNSRMTQIRRVLLISIVPISVILIIYVSIEVSYRRKLKRLMVIEQAELEKEISILDEITSKDKS